MSGHPLEVLTLYASGELSAAETAEIGLHLADCASCRSALDGIRATLDLLGGLPRSEATFPDFLARRAGAEACDAMSEALTVHVYEGDDDGVARHAVDCLRCADRLAAIRSVRGLLDALPPSRATFAALRPRLRPSRLPWIAAAAVLIVLLAGAALLRRREPLPPVVKERRASVPSRAAEILSGLESVDDASLQAAAARFDRQNVLDALGLVEAMDDPADSFRSYAAIRILRYLETPAAEDLLVRALGKNGARDRTLVRALVELQSPHVVPWLVDRLGNPASRAGALDDLARIRDRSTIDAIANHLTDPRVGELLARFDAGDLIQACDVHRNAPLFVRIPSAAVQVHLLKRAAGDESFRARVLAAAADAGAPGAEFLMRALPAEPMRAEALTLLNLLPHATLERATNRALDRDDLASTAVWIVGELKLEALLPKLRRGVSSGRYRPEAALPVLAKLGDLDTLIFIARLRANEKMAKAAMAALENADPMLRSEAMAAAAPAEERAVFPRPPSAAKSGRFRRDNP